MTTSHSHPLRPRDYAILLLASRDLRPRKRARDQRADAAGLELKRRILEQVANLDPEPDGLSAALLQIIENVGPPLGPTRAVAAAIHEEWRAACSSPDWVAQLLKEAVSDDSEKRSAS
jgi:hypothetical protein